jgi:hypothetical protein
MRLLSTLLITLAALAADDPWTKVQDLQSGTEVRVTKTGAKQPLTGKFDQATEDKLLLVLKNEQVAIDKAEIERVEARPHKGGGVRRENRTTNDTRTARPINPGQNPAPQQSTSSNVTFEGKGDFEIVYRKPPKLN